MRGEPGERPSREEIVELDRSAWNLPRPTVAPAGPVHEVWPVREKPPRAYASGFEERSATA